ncbi:MAG: sulfatase [Planctomycetaceae bacterium]
MRHLTTLVICVAFTANAHAAKKPNFVFFLVDDLGYMDTGAYNPKTFYETPNVDRLAKEGMRFTNGYAACPVCSPSRYAIMAGKYPTRVDATNYFSGRRVAKFRPAVLNNRMPLQEVTLAETLKAAGYKTAFLGKWHLGPTPEFWPEKQGFDVNVGGYSRGMPAAGYFSPYKNPRLKDGVTGEHLTTRLTDEALRIIDESKDKPFLLYLSFYTVHTPLQGPKPLVDKYRTKAAKWKTGKPNFAREEQIWPTKRPRRVRIQQNHATYASMVESMDTSIGRVLKRLKDLGLDKNTVICFTSDNGGLSTSEGLPTSNLPLRGGKGWLYEGGIREPFIVKWPGVTKPGGTCDVPVIGMDFYPTLLEIAGLKPRPAQHRDGVSLVPLLKGTGKIAERPLFWHYPHYGNQGGFPGAAIRQGDWKLLERFEDGKLQLYNLKTDIGERKDLAEKHPDRVAALRKTLHAWYKTVDAKFLRAKRGGPKPWRP